MGCPRERAPARRTTDSVHAAAFEARGGRLLRHYLLTVGGVVAVESWSWT